VAFSNASTSSVKNSSYLSTQLMESAPYLKDAGWRETATLLIAAEIEELKQRVAELEISEAARGSPRRRRGAPFDAWRSNWLSLFGRAEVMIASGLTRPKARASRRHRYSMYGVQRDA
jgi:hypothetical protein